MADYVVAFWNLENLFAPENHPQREPWIAKRMKNDLTGWTQALFDRKIDQLTSIITVTGGPDVLGVCEVENRYVLDELVSRVNTALPGRQYRVIHANNTADQRGIDTAFVYDANRLTVDPAAVFSHFVMRRTGTRDITQVTFSTVTGHEFVAFANHWPSRAGGPPEQSAGFRATAGETLAYWHERVREVRGTDMPIIALGDLNDDPWCPSITVNANAGREPGDVKRSTSAQFLNLAWSYLKSSAVDHQGNPRDLDGTLYFNNDGNLFDQILVNRSLLTGQRHLTVDTASAGVVAPPVMVSHRVGEGPIPFGLPKGDAAANVNQAGYSDHFPVSVTLRET